MANRKPLEIVRLAEKHLEDAASLVSQRYQRLREQVPYLPDRYAEVDSLYPLLQNLFDSVGTGVAALRGNHLVGFLTAWQMLSFRGKRSIYSPEWGNAAVLEDSARIYEAMYGHIAGDWVAEKYVAHYISLFPNDAAALRAWYWLGFGMISVDALRSLDPIEVNNADVTIRCAQLQNLEQVMDLQNALRRYMKGSPIFLPTDTMSRSYYEEWLRNPDKVVWLAYSNDEPVAFMRLGPADQDVSTIIVDEKTTSIYAAFTKEDARSEGVATTLLAHALESARKSGYERCAVPFEPMNLLGTRFWLKYFNPVCYSVVRSIDNRLTIGELT